MNITAEQSAAHMPVTTFRLQGDLDGSNYLDLIAAAKTAQQNGAKHLLIDLGGVPYMSSAGLVALRTAPCNCCGASNRRIRPQAGAL